MSLACVARMARASRSAANEEERSGGTTCPLHCKALKQ